VGVKAISEPQHCKQCGSRSVAEFATEICVHIAGQENCVVPAVFIFPRLVIFLDCGTVAEFSIPEERLSELRSEVERNQRLLH
jgi:hypothetical protein